MSVRCLVLVAAVLVLVACTSGGTSDTTAPTTTPDPTVVEPFADWPEPTVEARDGLVVSAWWVEPADLPDGVVPSDPWEIGSGSVVTLDAGNAMVESAYVLLPGNSCAPAIVVSGGLDRGSLSLELRQGEPPLADGGEPVLCLDILRTWVMELELTEPVRADSIGLSITTID